MPARSAEAIKRKYQNRLRKNKQRRQALITALGNRCDWYRMGDCEGELELHHRYGHASDQAGHGQFPSTKKNFVMANLVCFAVNTITLMDRSVEGRFFKMKIDFCREGLGGRTFLLRGVLCHGAPRQNM